MNEGKNNCDEKNTQMLGAVGQKKISKRERQVVETTLNKKHNGRQDNLHASKTDYRGLKFNYQLC